MSKVINYNFIFDKMRQVMKTNDDNDFILLFIMFALCVEVIRLKNSKG